MHLLLKLLKAIQPPRLDKEGWGLVSDIYAQIEKKEFLVFQEVYLKTNKSNGTVAEFMRLWFEILQELQELYALIDKNLTEDDKIFIVSALIPKDTGLLNTIYQKLETLCHVAIKHSDSFDIIKRFSTSVLRTIKETNPHIPTGLNITLTESESQTIISDMFNALLIKKLNYFCKNYLNMIINQIAEELKNDTLCLTYYKLIQGNHEVNMSLLIQSEIEAIPFNAALIKPTATLRLLFKKFIRAQELLSILSGTIKYVEEDHIHTMINAPHDERLVVFSYTFGDYLSTFKKRTREASYSIFNSSNTTGEILESEFINVCSNIANNITPRAIKPMM